jgi:hypothetical protein
LTKHYWFLLFGKCGVPTKHWFFLLFGKCRVPLWFCDWHACIYWKRKSSLHTSQRWFCGHVAGTPSIEKMDSHDFLWMSTQFLVKIPWFMLENVQKFQRKSNHWTQQSSVDLGKLP